MEKEIDIENLVNQLDFETNNFNNINGLMLTNREILVLDKYKINYKNCKSLKEIIFEVEEILNDMDIVDEELDFIAMSISERDYYQNTNK
ncbi:MAG: hypothetical protein HFJ11_04655 [Bacilli bacterium]|nr:hypothetical protein [Bacilli bacterium]